MADGKLTFELDAVNNAGPAYDEALADSEKLAAIKEEEARALAKATTETERAAIAIKAQSDAEAVRAKRLGVTVGQLKAGAAAEAKATKEAAASTRHLADETGDTFSKLAQGFGIFGESAQAAATTAADAMDGVVGAIDTAALSGASLAATGTVLGGLALAIGGAGLAYQLFTAEMERAAQVSETTRQAHDAERIALRALEDANLSLAVARGDLTDVEQQGIAAALSAQRAIVDAGAAQREQIAALRETIATSEGWLDVLRETESALSPLSWATENLTGLFQSLANATETVGQKLGVTGAGASFQTFADGLTSLGTATSTAIDTIFGLSENSAAAAAQIGILQDSQEKVAAATKDAAKVTKEAAQTTAERAVSEEALRRAVDRKRAADDAARESSAKASEAARKHADDLKALAQLTEQVLVSAMGTEEKAVHDARKALDDYTAQIRATGQATPQTAAALAILNEQLADAQQAQRFAEGMRLASDEMWAVLEPVKQAPSAFAGLSAALAGIVPQQALDDLDAIRLKMLDAEAAFRQGKISAEEFAQLKLQGAQAQSTVQANAAASKTDVGLGVAAGLIGGSLSQALTPLLQTLGPQGAIAGAVLGLLEQGPEMITGIIDALPGLVTDIIGTVQTLITTLPDTLVGLVEGVVALLPDLLLTVFSLVYGPLAAELVLGIVEALPTIISGLVVGLTELVFMLPGILLDTARVVPVLISAAADIVPMMVAQIVTAIPELWAQGLLAFDAFRADLIEDLTSLVTRDRKERERFNAVRDAFKGLSINLDGRKVNKGLDRSADARKGGSRRSS